MNEGAQDGNGDGSGDGDGGGDPCRRTPDGNGDENGDGSEDSSGDGNGDDDNGNENENRIGEGGREAKKRKKPQKAVDAVRETGNTRVEREKKYRRERVGSVAANPDNLERATRKQWGEHKILRAQVRVAQVERVCPLCRA